MDANFAFGIHPSAINNAVMNPHAMNAQILGITIALKNLPNFCNPFFIYNILLLFLSSLHFIFVIVAKACFKFCLDCISVFLE